jgi:hypothetical protein
MRGIRAMTEHDWLSCTTPEPMLAFLQGKVSDRKLRLFACCCVRRAWHWLDEASRAAVEVAERYADGQASAAELAAAYTGAREATDGYTGAPGRVAHVELVRSAATHSATADTNAAAVARGISDAFGYAAGRKAERAAGPYASPAAYRAAHGAEAAAQAALLRCAAGNPFRPAAVDPAWLAWDFGAVLGLARRASRDAAFEKLPDLADALAAAGCENTEMINHCRGDGPHVRGCWVVDLLLGRE